MKRSKKRDEKEKAKLIASLDSSKYEKYIYKVGTKRKMYIVVEDYRGPNNNFLKVRQGDIVCQVHRIKEWGFVFLENNPKKYGFLPK